MFSKSKKEDPLLFLMKDIVQFIKSTQKNELSCEKLYFEFQDFICSCSSVIKELIHGQNPIRYCGKERKTINLFILNNLINLHKGSTLLNFLSNHDIEIAFANDETKIPGACGYSTIHRAYYLFDKKQIVNPRSISYSKLLPPEPFFDKMFKQLDELFVKQYPVTNREQIVLAVSILAQAKHQSDRASEADPKQPKNIGDLPPEILVQIASCTNSKQGLSSEDAFKLACKAFERPLPNKSTKL